MQDEKNILEEFLKTYYRKNPIPNEIIIEEEIDLIDILILYSIVGFLSDTVAV